jgi:hypothetical protein
MQRFSGQRVAAGAGSTPAQARAASSHELRETRGSVAEPWVPPRSIVEAVVAAGKGGAS